MNLAILDGILHGALNPAFIARLEPKALAGYIRYAKTIKPLKLNDLSGQQVALLHHFPNLTKQIEEYPASPIEQLPLESEIPEPQTIIEQFYSLLISNEILLRYNGLVLASSNWDHPIDQQYQVMKALRDLKVLAQQANDELHETKKSDNINPHTDIYPHFILKLHAISLYFSIQEIFGSYVQNPISLEDFYTLELLEQPQDISPLLTVAISKKAGGKRTSESETISFGFNSDMEKLKTAIFQLCRHINLLDQSQCTVKELIDFFTSKRVKPGQFKIYIGCETTQFRFVLDCLSTYFNDFSISTIEKAKTFYTKNGKLLTAQNIYSSRKENPKEWEEIRKIINQMQ